MWENNINCVIWHTKYFFFFPLIQASTYPFISDLEMSGQQQQDASTALNNSVNVAPFWIIFPNSCPNTWQSLSIYVWQTLQEE